MLSRFIRNATFNIVADFSNRISNAIIIILISKFLTLTEFGSFNLATSYLTIGTLISFWGYGNLLTREVSNEQHRLGEFFINFSLMRFIFCSISLAAIYFIVPKLNYSNETISVILIVSLGMFAESVKNLLYSSFNAFEKTYYVSFIYFINSIIKLILVYAILTIGYGIKEVAWITTILSYITAILLIVIAILKLPSLISKVKWKFCVDQTKLAFPLFLIALFSIAENRLDVLLLSGFYPENIVGLYSSAVVLQSALLIIPDGIRNAMFPILAKNSLIDQKKIENIYFLIIKFVLIITIGISVGGIILASNIMLTIYDEKFLDSAAIFRILMVSFPIYSIVIMNVRLLNAYYKDYSIAKIFAFDLALTIILNLLLTPKFGGIGAASIKLFATIILLILSSVQTHSIFPNMNYSLIIIKCLIASMLMALALFFISYLNLLLLVGIGLVTYFSSLLILRVIDQNDISVLRKVFHLKEAKA